MNLCTGILVYSSYPNISIRFTIYSCRYENIIKSLDYNILLQISSITVVLSTYTLNRQSFVWIVYYYVRLPC